MGLFTESKKTLHRQALYCNLQNQMTLLTTQYIDKQQSNVMLMYVQEALSCFVVSKTAKVKNKIKLKVLVRLLNNYGLITDDFYEGHYKYI